MRAREDRSGAMLKFAAHEAMSLFKSVNINLALQDRVITITYGGGVFVKEHFVKIIGK